MRKGIIRLHRSQGIVEKCNRQLSERLFTYQYSKELFTESTNILWVYRLHRILKDMNSELSRVTELKPVDAIKKKQTLVSVSNSGQPDLTLLNKTITYLYQTGEIANDTTKRTTDPVRPLIIYEVDRVLSTDPPII